MNESDILQKVKEDLNGQEAFSLRNLLDNPFTSAETSAFTINYNISNNETINIGSQSENIEQQSLANQTKTAEEVMEVDSTRSSEFLISSKENAKANDDFAKNDDDMLSNLLSCFENDKSIRAKIAAKIQTNNLFASATSTGTFHLFVYKYNIT